MNPQMVGYQQPQPRQGQGMQGYRQQPQQFPKDDYQDQRLAYGDVNANMRNPVGLPNQGMRAGVPAAGGMRGMPAQHPQQRGYPQQPAEEEYYDEDYDDMEMLNQMSGQQAPGINPRGQMAYDGGYEDYGVPP